MDRVAAVSGTLKVSSPVEGGTRLVAAMPITTKTRVTTPAIKATAWTAENGAVQIEMIPVKKAAPAAADVRTSRSGEESNKRVRPSSPGVAPIVAMPGF